MNSQFLQRNYMKVCKGNGRLSCQVHAQHAEAPKADLFTGQIVENLVQKTNCAGIISTLSRTVADLNRKPNGHNDEALKQYWITIKEILQHNGILDEKNGTVCRPYLHLTIHGMKDLHHGPYAIEIGTFNGQSCSKKMKKWFQETISAKSKEILPKITIQFDELFDGDESIVYHRLGDGKNYRGYGPHFHTFQIELSRTLREEHFSEIVELLSQMIILFHTKYISPS